VRFLSAPLLLLTALATTAAAQQPASTAGRVVRLTGRDSVGAPATRVVLHHIGHVDQGPIDSQLTDSQGRFRFRFRADTAAMFLLSARYEGIEYFSSPLDQDAASADTASSAPVSLQARYLVIRRAAADGSRPVLDLLILANRGWLTRVGRDSADPSWQGSIPRGIAAPRVGETDFSADAILLRNDSVLVFAPIAPGEKQIALEYTLPAGTPISIPFRDSVPTNILTQEDSVRIQGGTMAAADSQMIEGERFHRWAGVFKAGEVARISLGRGSGGGQLPGWVLPALVAVVGLGLLLAVVRFRPRRLSGSPLDALTDQIAHLEARYAGRQAEVSAEEWNAYLRDRERLRGELAGHLAARKPVV